MVEIAPIVAFKKNMLIQMLIDVKSIINIIFKNTLHSKNITNVNHMTNLKELDDEGIKNIDL